MSMYKHMNIYGYKLQLQYMELMKLLMCTNEKFQSDSSRIGVGCLAGWEAADNPSTH